MNTIYDHAKDLPIEEAPQRLGHIFLLTYLSSGIAKPLHDVSWHKLKEMPFARKYLPTEEEYARTVVNALSRFDPTDKPYVRRMLRDLRMRAPPKSSIDGMIDTIANNALHDTVADCWEDSTITEIGNRMYNALLDLYTQPEERPDALDELYRMIDSLKE